MKTELQNFERYGYRSIEEVEAELVRLEARIGEEETKNGEAWDKYDAAAAAKVHADTLTVISLKWEIEKTAREIDRLGRERGEAELLLDGWGRDNAEEERNELERFLRL